MSKGIIDSNSSTWVVVVREGGTGPYGLTLAVARTTKGGVGGGDVDVGDGLGGREKV